ncbi:glycoside hydrolase family 3 C-terminal domain-containing protein [Jatrophihabitans sp. YIM 134969]
MTRAPATHRRVARPLIGVVVAAAGVVALTGAPTASAAPAATPTPIYLDTHHSFSERAADLVSRMTLPEKVGQLRTNSAPAIPRLGVQAYTYWSEAQHGINLLGANTNSGSASGGPHATSFPTNMASSMSWDPQLTLQETTAISDEIRGELDKSLWGNAQNNIGPDRNAYGNLTYWAPTVNLDRDPRWGRTDEAFGEDPYFVGQMAGAFVDGMQGQTLNGTSTSPYLKVAATAKHFALNNTEDTRHSGSSNASDADIRNYYTAQFRDLVENSHVSGLMTSYNAINGTPSPANTYTTNELAQRTWGFGGYITSDCGGVGDIYSQFSHDWAPPGWTTAQVNGQTVWTETATGKTIPGAAGAEAMALRAGTQVDCTGSEVTETGIEQAIAVGLLSENVIDDDLTKLFTVRFQTGEFDPRSSVAWTGITRAQIESPQHQALARTVADNAIVLLKNGAMTGSSKALLPVSPAATHHVVVLGNLANTVTLGGYSGSPTYTSNLVQGLTKQLPAGTDIRFDACGTSTAATTPAACSAATTAAIGKADLVVVTAGTDGATAGEENDRNNLEMPGNYTSLISQVTALHNPRTVLALQTDGPVDLAGIASEFSSIVFSAYNGQSQGDALADVLFGKQNPDGHLNFTWYQNDSQLPAITNYGLAPADTDGLGRTYQYFTGTPTYAFGYGGSYSSFAYSGVKMSRTAMDANGSATLSFTVTNTGTRAGTTVAQVYVDPPAVKGVTLPTKQLVAFKKTAKLQPGQAQKVSITLSGRALARYDESQQKQVVYPGQWRFQLATDARHPVATLPVAVSGTLTPHVAYVTVQPDQTTFTPGQGLDLSGTNPWIADDTAQADQHVKADGIVEAVNDDQSFVDLSGTTVTYASSNPKVAKVDAAGHLTAKAPGVATITATVDGVTGSTPVAVREPLTVEAPALTASGSSFTATVTLPNPAGGSPLTGVTLTLKAPAGWKVSPLDPTSYPRVAAGQTVTARFKVKPPTGSTGGSATLAASATFTSPGGTGSASTAVTVQQPFASPTAAFDNVGISDDNNIAAASLDGGGRSFSAQALAAATPSLTPGQPVTHDGLTITWPDVAPGTPDNIVASGQAVDVAGSGTTLVFAGASNNGTAGGSGTIVYTDGTTQAYDLSYQDWWANAGTATSDVLTSTPYLNYTAQGRQTQQVSMYWGSVPLQAGKTVQYVTLPHVSDGPVSGLAMHVFALQIAG